MSAAWRERGDGLAIFVRLTPKGGRDSIDGIEEVVGSIPSGSTKFPNEIKRLENFGST